MPCLVDEVNFPRLAIVALLPEFPCGKCKVTGPIFSFIFSVVLHAQMCVSHRCVCLDDFAERTN